MLKIHPAWRVILLLGLFLGLAAWWLSSSTACQECQDEYYENYIGDSASNEPPITDQLGVWLGCLVLAIGEHFEVITALATIAVAAFTGALWWSTHLLWAGTENQLKVAKGAQRGFLFPGKPKVSLEFVANRIPSGFHRVDVPVRHIGASPVIFTEIYWEFRDEEPTESVAVYEGGATKLVDGAMDGRTRTVREIGPFYTNTADTQYLVGIIRFLDVWKEPHESRFCFKIVTNPDFITTSGSRSYNDWD